VAESLRILDELIVHTGKRKNRFEDLLKTPLADDPDWFFLLPPFFNDALDIKLTERMVEKTSILVWTQGSAFSFQDGDVLYPKSKVYETVWGEAFREMEFCLQVTQAESAEPEERDKKRNPGSVKFRKILFEEESDKAIQQMVQDEMTQDDFVHLLITGKNIRGK